MLIRISLPFMSVLFHFCSKFVKYPPLGISKISAGLCLSLPKLHQAWAWHHHALMIKYQGTPLDILLVQQDGWNGQNKAGCVYSLSHQRLPFFCPAFLSFPSRPLREVCIRKTWWISFWKGDFQCWKGNVYFFVPDAPVLLPLCLSSASPSSSSRLPFFLLFYLRSLSEGLTISSSVSLLSCSAVYCLWFAQAHPCGCLFQQPSVTWWIEEDHAESSHGYTPLLAALGHTGSPHLCTHTDVHAHYLTCQVVEAMGCGTWTCLAAGISWIFV